MTPYEQAKLLILKEIQKEELQFHPKDFFPGFIIICENCGSIKIRLDNSLGWSPESGGWGSVDIVCSACTYRCPIVEG